jgi:hypothetical protein
MYVGVLGYHAWHSQQVGLLIIVVFGKAIILPII